LFWTSSWSVVWLPVLALFRHVCEDRRDRRFQLGERLLLATHALLPPNNKPGDPATKSKVDYR